LGCLPSQLAWLRVLQETNKRNVAVVNLQETSPGIAFSKICFKKNYLKIIFKNKKKYYFNIFLNKKHFKNNNYYTYKQLL
jgi:hypothetical protein